MALYMGGVKIAGSGAVVISHLSAYEAADLTSSFALSAPAYITLVNDTEKHSKASIEGAEVCLSGCGTLQCGPYHSQMVISAGTDSYCPSRIIVGYLY